MRPNSFGGGDGKAIEQAVIINATSSSAGIDSEYQWLATHFGRRGIDWIVETRMHHQQADRIYETFTIKTAAGAVQDVYFDITAFYGRFSAFDIVKMVVMLGIRRLGFGNRLSRPSTRQ
jgi:hypothetical protein